MFLQNHRKTVIKNLSRMANGVMEAKGILFWVSMSNLRIRPVKMPKGSVIGIALPAPKAVVPITARQTDDPDLTTPTDATANGKKPTERTQGPESQQGPWIKQLQVGAEFGTQKGEIVNPLREFEDTWSGRLGAMAVAKHRLDLEEGARPVYRPAYRAGIKAERSRMPRSGECWTK